MSRRFAAGLPVILIVALLPLHHALAAGRAPVLGPEFGEFWHTGLATLEETAPHCTTFGAHGLRFGGLHGMMRTAWFDAPGSSARGLVIHITDAPEAAPVPPAAGLGQIVFAWREGVETGPESVADSRQHPLYRAILDASRLTRLAAGALGAPTGAVALVGEGYGAGVALAVAALMPDKVCCVVAHQPISLDVCAEAQVPLAPEETRRLRELRATAMRLSARSFAAFVGARVLVTVGTDDPYATPAAVTDLYEALPGEKLLWVLEGVGHVPAQELPDWQAVWRAWVLGGAPPA